MKTTHPPQATSARAARRRAAPAAGLPSPPMKAAQAGSPEREALIRLAAFKFYERRGCIAGHELEDWLQAEMEVDRQSAAEPRGGTAS